MADDTLVKLAKKQWGLFSRAQALASGVTRQSVTRRLQLGTWDRFDNCVYRFPGGIDTWHTKVMAATLALGHGAMASHRTAAYLWEIDNRGGTPCLIEVMAKKSSGQRTRRAKVHRSRRLPEAVLRSGIPTTPLARTLLDLSAVLSEKELFRVLDAARPKHGDILASVVEELRKNRKGRQKGTELLAVALLNAGKMRHTDSWLEGEVAHGLVGSPLPIPTPQYVIRDADGTFVARVDFAWVQHRVVLQADSRDWHLDVEAWEKDIAQRRTLESLGWRVVAVTKRSLRASTWIADVGALLTEVDPFGVIANAPLWGG